MLSACGGGGKPSTVSQQVPAAGATVTLGKDVTLQIPAGALADATKVTITKKNAPGDALAGGQSLGSGYNIDLGGQTLAKPVTLEIAYDPKKLPANSADAQAFVAYYDEQKGMWVPAGGTVDAQRNVISIQTDHLSWWNPFSWNWGAWIAVLNNLLTGNVTDFLHAVNLLTTGCAQTGSTVSVDASKANNVIQGCVEHDDPSSPQLRVVNPKSFFYEVKPLSGGNGYPPDTMLGPGDDLKFQASTSDPAPLVVQAEITQKAGLYLIVHLVIQMLPGLNELGIQGPQIACITEKLSDVSYFVSASEALLVSHDGAAAAEQLVHFLNDGGAVQRFITAASDCNYGAAPTWSVEGIKQIGSATATIISATDFVANYLLNNQSQVAFNWTVRAPSRPVRAQGEFTCKLGVPGTGCADFLIDGQNTLTLDFDLGGGSVTGTASGQQTTSSPSCTLDNKSDLAFTGDFDAKARRFTGTVVITLTSTITRGTPEKCHPKLPGEATPAVTDVGGTTTQWQATLSEDGRTVTGTFGSSMAGDTTFVATVE